MPNQNDPEFEKKVFSCPYCHVTATQTWYPIFKNYREQVAKGVFTDVKKQIPEMSISICTNCNEQTLWYSKKIIHPITPPAPLPHEDMPVNVKEDYLEAREIVDKSPRAAAALLRLALEKLLPQIGATGTGVNEKIASLVKKGLDEHIQQSLDIVRVIGNSSVHPGLIDIKDDLKTSLLLFDILNLIVETKISHPKRINSVYQKLPGGIIKQIFNRDNK